MARLMLASVPFHTPASPPLGIATLKGALARARPDAEVRLADYNLSLFRRWLLGEPPHLCPHTADRSLGAVCPNALVSGGEGARLWDALTAVPTDAASEDAYIDATRRFDGLYATLAGQVQGLLRPWIEGRTKLSSEVVDLLFGDALADIAAFAPDLLGVSVLTERNLTFGVALLRAAKERLGVRTALGGAMTSHLEADELLTALPWLDVVFIGEAEGSLAAWIDAFGDATDGHLDLERVPGIAHRGPDGSACRHPAGPAPAMDADIRADFEGLTPARYLAPLPTLPIAMGRGCYWGKCTFCSHTRPYADGVRERRVQDVAAELAQHAADHGVRSFLFVDEAISPRQLRRMSGAIAGLGLDLLWGAEGIRVERRFDVELLQEARESGLRWLYAGVESSTQRLLDRMDKGIEAAAIEPFISACERAGVVPQLSFIVGVPGTTRRDLEAEAVFMRRHPVDGSTFALLLGSPLHRDAGQHGLRVERRQRLLSTTAGIVHAPRFDFTATVGLAPATADRIIEELLGGQAPRLRPHLGEVHAIALADAGFFTSQRRPAPPPSPAEIALRALDHGGDTDPWHALDVVGCHEVLGDLPAAHAMLSAALSGDPPAAARPALWLHMAAILNRAGHAATVLEIIAGEGLLASCGPAAHAEAMRAAAAVQQPAAAIAHGRAMLSAGYEFAGAWELLGELLQATGQLDDAVAALNEAEARCWSDPRINDTKARCLRAARLPEGARREAEAAARKRAFFATG